MLLLEARLGRQQTASVVDPAETARFERARELNTP